MLASSSFSLYRSLSALPSRLWLRSISNGNFRPLLIGGGSTTTTTTTTTTTANTITSANNNNNNYTVTNPIHLTTIRYKHSKRQIKRIFENPARRRIQKKLQAAAAAVESSSPPPPPPPPPLQRRYEPIFTPVFLPNGWSAPPPQQQNGSSTGTSNTTTIHIPEYPFSVSRTRHKPNNAVGFLPVYTKHRHDGTKVTTRIKKIKGNVSIFLQELQAVLQLSDYSDNNNNKKKNRIRIRTGGMVEIDGNHARKVREWLAGLGF